MATAHLPCVHDHETRSRERSRAPLPGVPCRSLNAAKQLRICSIEFPRGATPAIQRYPMRVGETLYKRNEHYLCNSPWLSGISRQMQLHTSFRIGSGPVLHTEWISRSGTVPSLVLCSVQIGCRVCTCPRARCTQLPRAWRTRKKPDLDYRDSV